MKSAVWFAAAAIAVVSLGMGQLPAEAGNPLGWGQAATFGGFGYGWASRVGSPYSIPYYALHPPVYYSQAVPRTFGYSPFPYPGTFRTPEVEEVEVEAIMVPNPHVQPEEEAGTTSTQMQTASLPLEIVNPYVDEASITRPVTTP